MPLVSLTLAVFMAGVVFIYQDIVFSSCGVEVMMTKVCGRRRSQIQNRSVAA